jgi:RNA polymerase sigma-70 factor, ECF subfamily
MEALQGIPDPYRAALSLFYIQDFSCQEIAEILEISPGTVMSRLYRGEEMLKKKILWLEHSPAPKLQVLRHIHGS